MKHLVWLCVPLALLSLACGTKTDPKSCEKTGCPAGSTCNAGTGACDITATGGGGGETGGGGGATGGGGGTTGGGSGGGATGGGGGTTGGGSGGGGGVVVDPFNDGGVFAPGAICSNAIAVNFGSGTTATLTVDLADAGNEYKAPCGSTSANFSGNDAVFAVTLAQPQKLTVTATNTSTDSQDPVIAVVREPCPGQQFVACSDESGSSAPETLTVGRLPAGTWYVMVDNYTDGINSTYSVQFDLAAPEMVAANDSCAAPTTLVPNMTQMVNLTNTLTDAAYACTDAEGGDVVYTFTTTQPQKVTLSLDGTTDSHDGVLLVREGSCSAGTDRACADAEGSSLAETLVFNSLPAGTYFVFASGYRADDTTFGLSLTLDAALTPPANDSCAAPQVVTLAAGTGSASAALDTANIDLASDLCAEGASGNDLVYSVEVPAGQTLTVVATPTGTTTTDVVLFARTGSCTGLSLECEDVSGAGSAETLTVPNLTTAPLTVFVVVKSYDSNGGPVDVTFTAM